MSFRSLFIAAAVLIPLAGLQVSCSSLPAAEGRLQISWSELSEQAGGAKGAVQLASGVILATRTAWHTGEVYVACSRSSDGGAHWQDISVIAKDRIGQDLGDGHLVQLPDGAVLFSYRHNQLAGTHHSYVSGVLPLHDGSLLVTCQDFATYSHRAFRGVIAP